MTSLESRSLSEHQPSLSEITLDGLNNQDESESDGEDLFQDSVQEQHSSNNKSTINVLDSKPSSSNQNGYQNSISTSNPNGDMDIDAPPAFPSLNSHQRSSASRLPISDNPNSHSTTSTSSSTTNTSSNSSSLKSLLGIPSTSSSLLVPPRTTALTAPAGVGGASGANLRTPTANSNTTSSNALGPPGAPPKKESKKVALAPGCSPLDWAKVKKEQDLRGGITQLMRITPSMLKKHNKPEDAWSAFNGKVYNLTPYLRFHPGGEEELMRCAGRDGTRLFMLTHSWVNIDAMIDTAMVGMLVPEH